MVSQFGIWDFKILRMADAGTTAPATGAPANAAGSPAASTGAPAGVTAGTPGSDAGKPAAGTTAAPDPKLEAVKNVNDALATAGDKKTDAQAGTADDPAKAGDAAQAEADKAAKDAADAATEAKKWEAPTAEIYKDLKYPDGFEAQKELVDHALEQFKTDKITPELAQKMVDLHIDLLAKNEAGWMKEVNTQFEAFTKDAEFWKDSKLTPAAEQAYGKVKNQTPETQSFFAFLNKNGGLFHPGFAQIVKTFAKGLGEGGIHGGQQATEKTGAKSFYAKSNHKND